MDGQNHTTENNSHSFSTTVEQIDDFTDPRMPLHFNEGLLDFNKLPDATRKIVSEIIAEIQNRKDTSAKIDFSGPFFGLTPSVALNESLVVRQGVQRKIQRVQYVPLPSWFPINFITAPNEGDEPQAIFISPPTIALSEHQQRIIRQRTPLLTDIVGLLNVTASSMSTLRNLRNLKTNGFDGQLLLDFVGNNQGLFITSDSWAKATTVRLGLGLKLALNSYTQPYMADLSRFGSGWRLQSDFASRSFRDTLLARTRPETSMCPFNSDPLIIDVHPTPDHQYRRTPQLAGTSMKNFLNNYTSILTNRVLVPTILQPGDQEWMLAYQVVGYCFVDSNMTRDQLMTFGLYQFGNGWDNWYTTSTVVIGNELDGSGGLDTVEHFGFAPIPNCNKLAEVPSLPAESEFQYRMGQEDPVIVHDCINIPVYLCVFVDQYQDSLNSNFFSDYSDFVTGQDEILMRYDAPNAQDGYVIDIWILYNITPLDVIMTAFQTAYNTWSTRCSTEEEREIVNVLAADLSRRRSIQNSDTSGHPGEGNENNINSTYFKGFKYPFSYHNDDYYNVGNWADLDLINPDAVGEPQDAINFNLWKASMTSCSGIRVSNYKIRPEDDSIIYDPSASIPIFNKELIASYLLNLFQFDQKNISRTPKYDLEYWYTNFIADHQAMATDIISQSYYMRGWKSTLDDRYAPMQQTASTVLDYCRVTKHGLITAIGTQAFLPSFGDLIVDQDDINNMWLGQDMPIVTVNPMYISKWVNAIGDFLPQQKRVLNVGVMQKTLEENVDILFSDINPYTKDFDELKNYYWLSLSSNYRYSSQLTFDIYTLTASTNRAWIADYANYECNRSASHNWQNLLQLEWSSRAAWRDGVYKRATVPAYSIPYLLFPNLDPQDDINTQIFYTGNMLHTGDDKEFANYYLECSTSKLNYTPITRANAGRGVKRQFGRILPLN